MLQVCCLRGGAGEGGHTLGGEERACAVCQWGPMLVLQVRRGKAGVLPGGRGGQVHCLVSGGVKVRGWEHGLPSRKSDERTDKQ